MLFGNFAEMTTSTPFRDLLHAANLRHGTDGFTSPPKEGVLRIFFAFKNQTTSVGFEPANLGTKGQHATPRPQKSYVETIKYIINQHLFTYLKLRSTTRYMIYLLTAIGLSPGGSSTVHVYTKNNTQNDTKQTIHRTTQ